jgi:hypothetical protein
MSQVESSRQIEGVDWGWELMIGGALVSVLVLIAVPLLDLYIFGLFIAYGWLMTTVWTFTRRSRRSRRDRLFAGTALAVSLAATVGLVVLTA